MQTVYSTLGKCYGIFGKSLLLRFHPESNPHCLRKFYTRNAGLRVSVNAGCVIYCALKREHILCFHWALLESHWNSAVASRGLNSYIRYRQFKKTMQGDENRAYKQGGGSLILSNFSTFGVNMALNMCPGPYVFSNECCCTKGGVDLLPCWTNNLEPIKSFTLSCSQSFRPVRQ